LLRLLFDLGFVAGIRPQGASASKEAEGFPEGSKGDMSASTGADAAVLDALYGDLPFYQPKSAEGPEVEEAAVPEVPSLPVISTSEVQTVLPNTALRVIVSPTSPTLVVEPAAQEVVASPTSAVAGVLVSLRTPPRSPLACPAAVDVPASSSAVVSTRLVDCSEVVSRVDEAENDFIGNLVDSFYNSLEQTIGLVLKGSPVPFSKLKMVLSRGIECIRDFEGYHQATALELLVDDLEKDVEEWRHFHRSDAASLADERLARLVAQKREAQLAAQEAVEAISSDLRSLEAEEAEVGSAIDASNSALLDAEDKIKRAEEMIRKANLLLSKATQMRHEESARLKQLRARSEELAERKSSQRATLAETEARLAQAVDFDEAELRSQALAQAEDDRRTRLASLGDRIRSYHVRL